MYLTASVGVSHANTVGEVDLAQGADDAMSVAKEQGGNHAVSFTGSMHQERRKQAKLQEALRRALACEGELTLAYQQVVSVADSPVVAVEVLARWTHPSLGDISPGIFIPLAEERGLIARLGRKLMELAVREAADRRLRWPDGGLVTNLNMSPVQFAAGDVIAEFADRLDAEGLPTGSFCIEVTEGAFIDSHAVRALEKARSLVSV